jgi:hypothetical protein
MRILIIISLIAWSLAVPESAFAASCGVAPVQPTAPAGCRTMEPTCVCDVKGNCHWEFICLRQ